MNYKTMQRRLLPVVSAASLLALCAMVQAVHAQQSETPPPQVSQPPEVPADAPAADMQPPTAGSNATPSLDELLGIEKEKPSDTPLAGEGENNPSTAPQPDDTLPLNPDVEQELSATEAADAFKQAIGEMDIVAQKLDKDKDAGPNSQRMQEEILRKLEQVIKSVKKQQQQGQSSGQPREQESQSQDLAQQQQMQQGSAQDSGSEPNQGEFSPGSAGQAGDNGKSLEETREEWGKLPARLRDELTEGLSERFSPIYRRLTEEYYKRIAEDGE